MVPWFAVVALLASVLMAEDTPSPPLDWQFKLVDGVANVSGRLMAQPYAGAPFGTVCDDGFTERDAVAACQSVGQTSAKVARFTSQYGPGTGPIYIANFRCATNQRTLQDCNFTYYPQGDAPCQHFEDVGIDCAPPPVPPLQTMQFTIEPKPGGQPDRGRLLVRPNRTAQWGTVCDDGFNEMAAMAACRSMSYDNITFAMAMPFYGGGNGTIYMDDVHCTAQDTYLQNCSFVYSTPSADWSNCKHFEDVGVDCSGVAPINTSPLIVYEASVSNTIAPLGTFADKLAAYLFTDPSRIILTVLHTFPETRNVSFHFTDPPAAKWFMDVSRDDLDYFMTTIPNETLQNSLGVERIVSNATRDKRVTELRFRLANGTANTDGVLQVLPIGVSGATWGTVCNNGEFGRLEAMAACRSAGFDDTAEARVIPLPVNTSGTPIYLSNVYCSEDQLYVQNCSYFYDINICDHTEDVAVSCVADTPSTPAPHPPPADWRFTLDGGATNRSGRLLVRPSEQDAWGTVCSDLFNEQAAKAACNSLGFTDTTFPNFVRFYGGGNGTIYMDDVSCGKDDQTLQNCGFIYSPPGTSLSDCTHVEDVGVYCPYPPPDRALWTARLKDGNGKDTGRLEVLPAPGMEWGTVCSDGFDDDAALAVCRTLGFKVDFATAWYIGVPPGTGTIYVSDTSCVASDDFFQNCSFAYHPPGTVIDEPFCTHQVDVGVDCSGVLPPPPTTYIYTAKFSAVNFDLTTFLDDVASLFLIDPSRVEVLDESNIDDATWLRFQFTSADDNEMHRADLDFLMQHETKESLETLGILQLSWSVESTPTPTVTEQMWPDVTETVPLPTSNPRGTPTPPGPTTPMPTGVPVLPPTPIPPTGTPVPPPTPTPGGTPSPQTPLTPLPPTPPPTPEPFQLTTFTAVLVDGIGAETFAKRLSDKLQIAPEKINYSSRVNGRGQRVVTFVFQNLSENDLDHYANVVQGFNQAALSGLGVATNGLSWNSAPAPAPAPPPGGEEPNRLWIIAVVVGGAVAAIIIGLIVRSKMQKPAAAGYDADYIAMMDYRGPQP